MTEQNELTITDLIIRIRTWIIYLKTKKLIVFTFLIIGMSVGIFKGITSKPLYKSSTKFMLQSENQGFSLAGLTGGLLGSGGASSDMFSETNFMEIIFMRPLFEKTLLEEFPEKLNNQKISYLDYYLIKSKKIEEFKKDEQLKSIKFNVNEKIKSRIKDSIIGSVIFSFKENMVSIGKVDEENSILKLEVESIDEKFSKYFGEELLKNVSEYAIENKIKKHKITVSTLEKQVDSVRRELFASMGYIASSSDNLFGLNPALQSAKLPSSKKQVDVQANTIILSELVKHLELARMNLLNQKPLIHIVEKPIFPLEMKKFGIIKGAVIYGFISFIFTILILLFTRFYKEIKFE